MISGDELRTLVKKPSKYRNTRVEVDGVWFDSGREAERWRTLRILEQAKAISNLERQVRFPLLVNGVKIGHYVADFTYTTSEGEEVVEDVKSPATAKIPLYRWKKKMMAAQYGVTIKEV